MRACWIPMRRAYRYAGPPRQRRCAGSRLRVQAQAPGRSPALPIDRQIELEIDPERGSRTPAEAYAESETERTR